MDANRSDRPPPGWWQAIGAMVAVERLAALGALICGLGTVLPWYRAPVESLVRTGLADFGFAMGAQLITVGAAIALLLQGGRGRRPPRPLHEGALLALAGFWAGAIIVFLMFDRPQFELAGFDQDYSLAYGIFVSLGGAALLAIAGLRIRTAELARERTPE
ncbi:MAG: hypothetical protein ACRDKV_10320 [Solirubrobacterales bacterium]